MKNIYYLFLIFSSTSIYSQSFSFGSSIIGGNPIDISQAPYQVSIEYDNNNEHRCGGTIIDCEWIVTAGHCIPPNPSGWGMIVHAGATDQSNNNIGQRIEVDAWYRHPNYSIINSSINNDIALLHLSTPLEFNENVQAIPLANVENMPPGTLSIGNNLTITGWGDTGEGELSDVLMSASIPIIDNVMANEMITSLENECAPNVEIPITNSHISVYKENTSGSDGDSGGPAIVELSNTERYFVGVASFTGCPRGEFPTIYSSVESYDEFINDVSGLSGANQYSNLEIDTDITWSINDTDIKIFNNLTLNSGATLTIENGSTIRFSQESKLIIKNGATLILEGTLTDFDCGWDNWQGVLVEDGGTIIVNDGVINSAFYAVHALTGSNVDIFGLTVTGDGSYEHARTGLYLDGQVNANRLSDININNYYIGILCIESNSYYDFDKGIIANCFTGIKLTYAPARIFDFNITVGNDGINAFQSPGTLIEENRLHVIEDNNNSDSNGIIMWWCDASVIRNNIIGTDLEAPNTGISLFMSNGGTIKDMNVIRGGRSAIFAFNTDFSIIQNDISAILSRGSNIGVLTLMLGRNNRIKNNYIDAQNVTHGINTIMSSGTQIENNEITTYFGPTYNRSAAIKSEGSNSEIIKNNIVNCKGNSNGILANNTAGNTYDCNNVTVGGQKDALSVLYNSQGQSVKGNTLSAFGQDILIRSIIGEQVHEGNEFCGGNALAEDFDIAASSLFFVNSIYTCHLPSNPLPIDWFRDQTEIHNFYTCANTPGPNWIPFWDDDGVLCSYYLRIINEHGYNSKEYIRMIQTMLRYARHRVGFELPDCIKDDPVLSECWKKLVQAEDELTSKEDGRNGDRNGLLGLIEGLSTAYQSGNGEVYHDGYKTEMIALSSSLSDTKSEYNIKLQSVKDLLDSIDCTDSIIIVALPILQEYIRFMETEDKSTFDYSTLINYSRLCADDYGPYIHLARGIVYPVTGEYFDQYDDCRSSNVNPRSIRVKNIEPYVYPNPSSGMAIVNFGQKRSGRISIFDISGRKIYENTYEDQMQIDIDLSNHIGVNMIHIYHRDGTIEVLKHISIK